ncbi:MAG TPA: ACT domain-containing protein [Candidatus Pullichristensenella excrementipullorum]|nr:ACT domain-containing protein [Candidatus Pullichristensenella excrementipullorum]
MLKDYLIVEKSALPDYFLKVVEARRLLESGVCQQVSGACEQVGISRSTYYKYKDKVIEPTRLTVGRKAVLMLMLDHESGVLSKVLNRLTGFAVNILTITQSLPIHDRASVTISMDISELSDTLDAMLEALSQVAGVESLRLVAVE